MAAVFTRAFEDSNNAFPINFERVWTFLGYSTKANALRKLSKRFAEGVDYCKTTVPTSGAWRDLYHLTTDAFENFALMAESRRGTLVRDFFVALKKQYFQTLANTNQQSHEDLVMKSSQFLMEERQKLAQPIQIYKATERRVREELFEREGGIMEVACKCGQADLLTEEEVVEVKSIFKWKHALGQVLAYSTCFPEHRARIHLYQDDAVESSDLSSIIAVCAKFDVRVTLHHRIPEDPKRALKGLGPQPNCDVLDFSSNEDDEQAMGP